MYPFNNVNLGTYAHKEIFASTEGIRHYLGGVVLLKGTGLYRKGQVLGKITASGKFRKRTSTTLHVAVVIGNTTITVHDAAPFVAGDAITVEAEALTVASVDTTTNVITTTTAATAAHAIDSAVVCTDGSKDAVLILGDDYVDTTDTDMEVSGYVGGDFVEAQIIGLDTAGKTALSLARFF